MRLPWQLGYALIGAALAADCLLIACAAGREQTDRADRSHLTDLAAFPDITDTPPIGCPPGITWGEVIDRRPFVTRLLASLRPWGETGSARARLRLDESRATLAGSSPDDAPLRLSDWTPSAFAIGLSGGAEFRDFSTW